MSFKLLHIADRRHRHIKVLIKNPFFQENYYPDLLNLQMKAFTKLAKGLLQAHWHTHKQELTFYSLLENPMDAGASKPPKKRELRGS